MLEAPRLCEWGRALTGPENVKALLPGSWNSSTLHVCIQSLPVLFTAVSEGKDLGSGCSRIRTMPGETQEHFGALPRACKIATPLIQST